MVESLSDVDKDDYEETGSGSSENITDDILSVYRQYGIWSGETKTETIVRPLRPRPDWPGWDESTLRQPHFLIN